MFVGGILDAIGGYRAIDAMRDRENARQCELVRALSGMLDGVDDASNGHSTHLLVADDVADKPATSSAAACRGAGVSHIYHPDLGDPARPAILVDGCPSCEDHAKRLADLDDRFFAALWQKMVTVNRGVGIYYASHAEATACGQLWEGRAFILERCTPTSIPGRCSWRCRRDRSFQGSGSLPRRHPGPRRLVRPRDGRHRPDRRAARGMVMFAIGLVVGASFSVIVMGLLSANAYDRGQRDILVAIARRRGPAGGRGRLDAAGMSEQMADVLAWMVVWYCVVAIFVLLALLAQ